MPASSADSLQGLPARPPRGVVVRAGVAEDEFACFDVMRRSMGYEMSWQQHSGIRTHLRASEGAAFWVAEEAARFGLPKIIGYARSIVRDNVWMLTEFFVLSGHHRKGIGRSLLAKCLSAVPSQGASHRMVLASQHPSADALYMRVAGCYPRLPMLLLAGSLSRLVRPADLPVAIVEPAMSEAGAPEDVLTAYPLVMSENLACELANMDRDIIGYSRLPEHLYWLSDCSPGQGVAMTYRRKSGELSGYAYLTPFASGPMVAIRPEYLPAIVLHVAGVLAAAARPPLPAGIVSSQEHYLAVAGTNEVMLDWLLDSGWQIVFQYLFMSTQPLGRPEHYVCHNPLYVL